MLLPTYIKIVEVSQRDGLQNEKTIVPTPIKIEFINRLSATGLSVIEATSFVSPKWIPQLADHVEVYVKINKKPGIHYPVLIPNKVGFERAMQAGVKEIAVFTAPSEQFCLHNINCSVAESLKQITDIVHAATQNNIPVRAYLSCVLGCPYAGEIKPEVVSTLAEKLFSLGCYEISLGDTIGVGTPPKAKNLIEIISNKIPVAALAVHFHDTYGHAIENIRAVLPLGISVIDSSVAGLGGCPYAKNASGNVATENILNLLEELGMTTGVDREKLILAGKFITDFLRAGSSSSKNS